MIINALDLGGNHPYPAPMTGQGVGSITVEGIETVVYPRGAMARRQTVSFFVRAWQAIGGASADTAAALKYLLKQVEEIASNRDQQPVYIQWTATAQGGQINATELHDGWYVIEDFEPDERGVDYPLPMVQCRMTVAKVAPSAPRSVALVYIGGPLSTNYSGSPVNLVALPVGSIAGEGTSQRVTAEGNIPILWPPIANPEPVVLSATIANIFKGGVHVYDTIDTGINPVPLTGAFVNSAWVEVFDADHNFVGDCVITNGLLLLIFPIGLLGLFHLYVWDLVASAPQWLQIEAFSGFNYNDNSANQGTLRQYSLVRVGPEECAISGMSNTTGGNAASFYIRLKRGHYDGRISIRPLTQSNTFTGMLEFGPNAGTNGIIYNSTVVADPRLSAEANLAGNAVSDQGYVAGFDVGTSHYVYGLLSENQITDQLRWVTNRGIALGDTSGPALNATREYGFFAFPYGKSGAGAYTVANLQAEGESGTLGTGWSSAVDAGASAGSAAKAASGTASGNADTFGTAFIPAIGLYDVYFRVRVTSAAGAVSEMTLGLWDNDASAFVSSTTYRANQAQTAWGPSAWLRVAHAITPTSGHNMRFRAVTAGTLGTDWFIDEAVLLPLTTTTGDGGSVFDHRGPGDIWSQFMDDRDVELIQL